MSVLNVIIDQRYNNYQQINSLMEDSNINELPPQFDIQRLRQAINELDYKEDGDYCAISADFVTNPSEYSHATLSSMSGNINAKLFEGNSPFSGRLKQGLRFSVHYFVIDLQMLEAIEEFYQCSRIKVGRNQSFSQRWIIYKEPIFYFCISKQNLESQTQWQKKICKRIEVYPYNNMSDIRLAVLKNQGLPQYYKGTFWILGGQFPSNPLKFKQRIQDKSITIPQTMLINDPEAYKIKRKFKVFTIIVEPQYQSIIPPLQVKCYLHNYKNSHYTCICRNERSYVCDKLCYDENVKHNRKCIYVPATYSSIDKEPIKKQQDKVIQHRKESGLFNQRNMCYFNTIVQCISHIRQLSQYFLSRNQQRQLNYWNKDGTFGQIALQYGRFIRQHHRATNQKSNMTLFSAVGRWNPAYANKNQQDSHQFLIKMLDWLKEDLNANQQKPVYREIESENKSEEQLARETQAVHKARNDSIIEKLMEGVQKSVIKCSHCSFASTTFDYFLTIQLPMARQVKQQIPVNSRFAYYIPSRSNTQDKVRRITITFDKDQTIMGLKKQVKACLSRSLDNQFQFFKVTPETAEQVTNQNLFSLLSIPESQKQVLFCVQKYRINHGLECIPVNLIFKGEIKSGTLPFCRPIYIKKTMEVQDLYVKVLDHVMKCKTTQSSFATPSGFFAKYFETQDFPFDLILKTESNEQLIPRKKQYTRYNFELGYELILSIRKNKEFDFTKLNNYTSLPGTIDRDLKKKIKIISPTIEECLKLYCKKELIEDGKWECSNCKMKRQASKTLYFKQLPSILILSINRFKQIYNAYSSTSQFHKNQSLIQYGPTLNMRKFTQSQQQQIYQLFAVACHVRIDESLKDVREMDGHYYAYIKTESGWLKFDDQDVTVASTEKVFNNKHAYILFYQKIIQS